MVYYFASNVVVPPVKIFMGFDKNENEDLIKWGWPEDVWFHVDKVSSAHVYLRLRKGQTIDDIPQSVLEDAAQLVKENSIEGCKMNNVDVVYTMWENLRKTASMDVGTIGFHDEREVRKLRVPEKINAILNRLNKTRKEVFPDLRALREERDRVDKENRRRIQREMNKEMARKLKEEATRRQEEEQLRCYSTLMQPENMTSNVDNSGDDSDDFM